MVANPNSNLVFDFPDPTPRFDFNDSPAKKSPNRTGSLSPKKKRFGLGKGKFGSSRSNVNSKQVDKECAVTGSPSTATTASLTSSLNSSLDSGNGRGLSPLKPRNHHGDIAAGPSSQNNARHPSPQRSQAGSNAGSATSQPSIGGVNFSFDSSPSTKLNLPAKGASAPNSNGQQGQQPGHARHPSSANSTSGYISEVSEFSFDRVTVTTNETGVTGQSSNVSWGFLDDTVMNAVGAVGGGQKGSPGNEGSSFVPYTGDTAVVLATNMAAANAAVSNSPGRNKNIKGKQHKKDTSNGTFDNVSLSSEELDNIPFNGIVNDSNQSVISEISEPTRGEAASGADDAVKALLREGMESARLRHRQEQAEKQAQNSQGQGDQAGAVNKGKGRESPSRETQTTARTTAEGGNSAKSGNFFEDMQSNYQRFKSRNKSGAEENKKGGILQSIVEDVQFCGLYFCGIDTTIDKANSFEDEMKAKKEERKREMDETFLGRVIQCGNEYGTGAFCAAL